ncbi:hypothetical protein [Halopseudomonas yangmingensis]|uniref:Uncharacterized protein n=1 Tax=Halopseudomonas yangmingensis TaxID=1720063 RepID=A0A1I4S8B2_9GAMM|nr:hypothetical protein [Halopseudomonas yangmingensis]SFM60581.1 hypothetical protein SAMN05216217_10951 [Halopseudomonas yangmingensis]
MRIPLLLCLAVIPLSLHADDGDSDLTPWMVERITPVHDSVSRWVSNTSRNIDDFFGSDDSYSVENRSFLRLSSEFDWQESEDFETDLSIRARLDLPTTRDRLRLLIESDPEERQGTLADQGSQRLRRDQNDSSSTTIGLDHLDSKDKREGWATRFGGGVRFRLPLDPYVRLTSERLWDLGNGPWQLGSYNRLSWFNSDGYSARSRWDIGRPLSESLHLRYITQFQWQEEYDTLEFSQGAELNQILGRRSAMRYAAAMVGNSSSSPRINDYYLLTHYRRDLHREILYLDVIPELHFPRDANFDPRWAFTLRLEMLFRGDIRKRE